MLSMMYILSLIMCIFDLQVFPTIYMCFNYWTFDLLFKYSFSGLDSRDRRKSRKFDLKGSGVSHQNKAI